MERLADRVAIVVSGRKIVDRRVDDLKTSMRRVTLRFEGDAPADSLPGAISVSRDGRVISSIVDDWSEETRARLANGTMSIEDSGLSLEDAFVELVKESKARASAEAAR